VAARVRGANTGQRGHDPRTSTPYIFEDGIDGASTLSVRKFHHEGGKVYGAMDATPDSTGLINRCDEHGTFEARLTAGTLPD